MPSSDSFLTSNTRLKEAREMLTIYAANLDRAWSTFMVLSDTDDVWKSKMRSELDRVQSWLAQSDCETTDDDASLRRECVDLAAANAVSVAGCVGWPSSALLAFKLLCHRSALKSNPNASVSAPAVHPPLACHEQASSPCSAAGAGSMSIAKEPQ